MAITMLQNYPLIKTEIANIYHYNNNNDVTSFYIVIKTSAKEKPIPNFFKFNQLVELMIGAPLYIHT